MAATEGLTSQLKDEIEDPEEETFLLFSKTIPSHNLGFIDPKADSVDVTVGGREYTIHQSPTILTSNRANGTTGAVLWKLAPLFASWLSSPSNALFRSGALGPDSVVAELGCGISPLNALATRRRVRKWLLTDQAYVSRLVRKNVEENGGGSGGGSSRGTGPSSSSSSSSHAASSSSKKSRKSKNAVHAAADNTTFTTSTSTGFESSSSGRDGEDDIVFQALDWETDKVTEQLAGLPDRSSVDAVVTCDCIYNDTIAEWLVQTCVDVCSLKEREKENNIGRSRRKGDKDEGGIHLGGGGGGPEEKLAGGAQMEQTVCVVAQQLRSDDVFRVWLEAFWDKFRVWRVPDEMLGEGLRSGDGFVVHIGVLRE